MPICASRKTPVCMIDINLRSTPIERVTIKIYFSTSVFLCRIHVWCFSMFETRFIHMSYIDSTHARTHTCMHACRCGNTDLTITYEKAQKAYMYIYRVTNCELRISWTRQNLIVLILSRYIQAREDMTTERFIL